MSTVLDVMELIFAVLLKYVSLNDGPYTLLQNGSFFTFISIRTKSGRVL